MKIFGISHKTYCIIHVDKLTALAHSSILEQTNWGTLMYMFRTAQTLLHEWTLAMKFIDRNFSETRTLSQSCKRTVRVNCQLERQKEDTEGQRGQGREEDK